MERKTQQRGMESGKSSSDKGVRQPRPYPFFNKNGSEETSPEMSSSPFSCPVDSKPNVSSGSEKGLRAFPQQSLSAGSSQVHPNSGICPLLGNGWLAHGMLKKPADGSFGMETGHQKHFFRPESFLDRLRGRKSYGSPKEPPVKFVFKDEQIWNGGAPVLEYSSELDREPSSKASWMPAVYDGDLLPEKRGMRDDSSPSSWGNGKFQPNVDPPRPADVPSRFGAVAAAWGKRKPEPSNFPKALDFPSGQVSGTLVPCTSSRKAFEFPEEKRLQGRQQQYARLHVFADRSISFNDRSVSFVIQVLHVPKEFRLNPRLFTAVVHSPSGKRIQCRVRSTNSYIVNSFQGSFEADGEVGKYSVLVRMEIPKDQLGRFGGMSEAADGYVRGSGCVMVSRNYWEDSGKECLRIKCEIPQQAQLEPDTDQSWRVDRGRNLNSGSKLWGLTCDLLTNNLFYSERESHKVTCVTPEGQTVFKFGEHASGPEAHRVNRPTGITYDEVHRRLVLCDKDNHRVCFFSMDGKFISSFGGVGHQNGSFNYPWDVAVSPNGSIAVTDSKNKRIQFFDQYGNYVDKYTVFEKSPFDYKTQLDTPRGVCFDSTGSNVYVTDFHVNNVLKIPTDAGDELRHQQLLHRGLLYRPQGIRMDACGNLLVVDSRHGCLRHMSTQGEHLSGIWKVNQKPLSFPINVTTMSGGFVAVLSGNGEIVIF